MQLSLEASTLSGSAPAGSVSASTLTAVHGSHFNALWQRGDSGEWLVRLEPKRAAGRLPKRGAIMDVYVARRNQRPKLMTVRVVDHGRGGDGRPVALAERYKDPRFGRSKQ